MKHRENLNFKILIFKFKKFWICSPSMKHREKIKLKIKIFNFKIKN